MSDYLDPQNEELLRDFFVEAQEMVQKLEENAVVLESDPTDSDAIDEIFRAAHTLKGAAGTVQMDELASFTHRVEDSLDAIRNKSVTADSAVVDTILAAIDIIKDMLDARENGEVYGKDTSAVEAEIARVLKGGTVVAAAPLSASANRPAGTSSRAPATSAGRGGSESAPSASGLSEFDMAELQSALEPGQTAWHVLVDFDQSNDMNTVGGIQIYAGLKALGTILSTRPDLDALYEDVFYPQVAYVLASEASESEIRDAVSVTDVTTGASVQKLDVSAGESAGAEPKPQPAIGQRHDVPRSETAPAPAPSKAMPSADRSSSNEADESVADHQAAEDEPAPEAASVQPAAVAAARKHVQAGSILRVDSRRIDDLLNLVSETVINKATFNQVSAEFANLLAQLQGLTGEFRQRFREMLELAVASAGPSGVAGSGATATADQEDPGESLRRDITDRFGDLGSHFDGFESALKAVVARFRGNAQNLGRITSELQEGVMRIRMVPVSQIFSRFPRLVRDLSRSLDKHIELTIKGEDTELDKSVIEDLLDPLIHLVRNSIDHGVESTGDRKKAGKPEAGQITLEASNEGNMIHIEVRDDGRGIDVDKVRQKAVERGVLHPGKQISDVEAFNLIFDPGFSTAQQVTAISGRGVGLDVVRKHIEKLNGSVSVWSEAGRGTRFTIRIPLTLAIIQGLLVRVGNETYAIPITSVVDSHRIRPDDIRLLDNYEVFNVRDDVVSLIRLNRLFGIHSQEDREYHYVVVVGAGDKKMGLIVDSLIGEEDVVIKPLRDHYTNAPGIAGANITGDGSVALIIDVGQLLDLGLRTEREARTRRETVIA